MAKAKRFYTTIDVNWYDEWGHAVSHQAALLWILTLGFAKRTQSGGVLAVSQVRRVAPVGMTQEELDAALEELDDCALAPVSLAIAPESPPSRPRVAPIKGDTNSVVLHGWNEWNDPLGASANGGRGNHLRWHVRDSRPTLTCTFCVDENLIAPESRPDSLGVATRSLIEKRREEKSNRGQPNQPPPKPSKPKGTPVPEDFSITPHLKDWAIRGGYDNVSLEMETANFIDHHAAKGSLYTLWDRAWQKWIRQASGWARERGQSGGLREASTTDTAGGANDMFASSEEANAYWAQHAAASGVVDIP